jgi:hypothetical protein
MKIHRSLITTLHRCLGVLLARAQLEVIEKVSHRVQVSDIALGKPKTRHLHMPGRVLKRALLASFSLFRITFLHQASWGRLQRQLDSD